MNTEQSLSVVLPVHNAERSLATRVVELLEVLPELAERFEIIVVDDGSTDQTDDIAVDLVRCYPQVRFARHSEQLGVEASAETGVSKSGGDVVIVHAGTQPVNSHELQRMWQHRDDEELVVSQCVGVPGTMGSDVIRELNEWGRQVAGPEPEPLRKGDKQGIRRVTGRSKSSPPVPPPSFRFTSSQSSSSVPN